LIGGVLCLFSLLVTSFWWATLLENPGYQLLFMPIISSLAAAFNAQRAFGISRRANNLLQ